MPAAQPRFSKIWSRGSEVRTNLSLEDESSCHETATLPEQCDGAASIASGSAMRVGWQGREIDDFGNYLGGQMTPFRAPTPVVTAIENYALFI